MTDKPKKIAAPRSLEDPRARWFWRELAPICREKGNLNAGSALVLARVCTELAKFEARESNFRERLHAVDIEAIRRLAKPLGITL